MSGLPSQNSLQEALGEGQGHRVTRALLLDAPLHTTSNYHLQPTTDRVGPESFIIFAVQVFGVRSS